MENIKGVPIEYKKPEPSTVARSAAAVMAFCSSQLASGSPVLLCRRVRTLRPELLLGQRLSGSHPLALEPLVYRDTGEIAEVGFGRYAELRLPSTCPTNEATLRVKHFAARTLRPATPVAVGSTDPTELSSLTRHWQPRVHAAFAFARTEAHRLRELSTLWEPFGGAYALVPMVTYVQVRGASHLCHLVAPTDTEPNGSGGPGASLEQAWERLELAENLLATLDDAFENAQPNPGSSPERRESPVVILETDRAAWSERVADALKAIAQGELQKVVPARFAQHELGQSASLVSALYALGETHPDSTKFAFLGPTAAFLGATPEHLIAKNGQTLTTEALAGTTASSNGGGQAFTPKEYHEHTPVLDAILSSLSPFCSQLTHEVTPVPLRLPHVLHLRTAISGCLADPSTHVLDLVNALHPTPAVAGAPRATALEWIAQNEDFERGWYAGPVGWFDADGNGQFDVALRCGVLTHDRAVLFAGAGIVQGSVPESEFEETVLKLRAMQTALSARAPSVHHEVDKV